MIIWCGPVHLTSNINLYHSIFPPTAFLPTCSYYILSQKLQNIGCRLPPGTTLKDSNTNIFALWKPSQYLEFAICICILKEPTLGPPLAWDHLSSHWFHWLPLFSLHLLHSALEHSTFAEAGIRFWSCRFTITKTNSNQFSEIYLFERFIHCHP